MVIHKKDAEIGGRHARYGLTPVRGAAENLDERFGDPGGPDPGEATSSAASASCMRERAAQSLNPEMGRVGAEDPSTAFSAAPLGPRKSEIIPGGPLSISTSLPE